VSKPIEGVTIVDGNGVARSLWLDEQSAEKDRKTCESLGQTGLRLVHLREVVTCHECAYGTAWDTLYGETRFTCSAPYCDHSSHKPDWFCPHGERRLAEVDRKEGGKG
jgi:hypothetical protein